MNFAFHSPSTILAGAQSRTRLPGWLKDRGLRRPLLVTDPYIAAQPFFAELGQSLAQAGLRCDVFQDVQPDPTDANVRAGLDRFRAWEADSIVAVGGGSALDAAKIIGAAAANAMELAGMQGYERIPNAGPPLAAVPTTAGTGSEATKVAVITDTARSVKMMILDPKLMPSLAVVDFELTMTMPAALTAHVGVDTLTHGIEAYVSRKATPLTDPIALSCIDLVARHLPTAWCEPGDREARRGMSLAALQGGMAFTNSSVCLVHGMSRPIGALFHLPHGLSNAVLLPEATRFSIPGAPARYAEVSRTLGWCGRGESEDAACRKLVEGLERLNADLRIPRLGECLAGREAGFRELIPKMAADALASGSPGNNPVVPTADQIADLYRAAW